jgi:hypothetical protein
MGGTCSTKPGVGEGAEAAQEDDEVESRGEFAETGDDHVPQVDTATEHGVDSDN